MLIAPQTAPGTDIRPTLILPQILRVLEIWGLSAAQQQAVLGLDSSASLYGWRRRPPSRLKHETIERLSLIANIYDFLHALFGEGEAADQWLLRPNSAPLFHGLAPADALCSGAFSDVQRVYEYLFAQTQGLW